MGEHVISGKVREWIPLLEEIAEECGDFEAVLLLPRFADGQELEEYGIRSIEVDREDTEVNLCSDPSIGPVTLTVAQVLHRLKALPPECGAYSLFTASPPRQLGHEWSLREDGPILDLRIDDERHQFGFVGDGFGKRNDGKRPA